MKKHKYQGPAGEIEVKDPVAVRWAESTWFITLLTLGFALWGAYYLFLGNPSVFMGRALSAPHWDLKDDCAACHVPFLGVPDENCSECHQHLRDSIHVSLSAETPCYACHPEHIDGRYTPAVMGDRLCIECHLKLSSGPGYAMKRDREEDSELTYMPISKIFIHEQHWTKKECYVCHCIGEGTINVPTRDLHKMDSCLAPGCHDDQKDNCHYCHARYHEPREKSSKIISCLKNTYSMDKLRKKKIRIYCKPGSPREPGSGDLKICGTEIFVDPYRKIEEPTAEVLTEPPASPAPLPEPTGADPGSTLSPPEQSDP